MGDNQRKETQQSSAMLLSFGLRCMRCLAFVAPACCCPLFQATLLLQQPMPLFLPFAQFRCCLAFPTPPCSVK